MIGHALAHYRITAAIGAGGMGEVYRATDTKLGREVAIKVLPAELAQDPERLARFEREAKLLASLNHTNIAHVYGFESATLEDGSSAHFLAMELVPGEDLAERLKRGAIPVDEAIAIAKQIAEADPANDLLVRSAVDQACGSPGAVEPANGGLAGEQGVELLLADVVVPHVAGAHGQG